MSTTSVPGAPKVDEIPFGVLSTKRLLWVNVFDLRLSLFFSLSFPTWRTFLGLSRCGRWALGQIDLSWGRVAGRLGVNPTFFGSHERFSRDWLPSPRPWRGNCQVTGAIIILVSPKI